ncbi:MAG: response regulator [Mycobacterium leprae]
MGSRTPLILAVDDQPGVRRLLQELFKEVGYRVATAVNGQEAIALATVERPDLALLDVKMPVMDGLDALRTLKGLYPEMPVFMMTAVGDGEQMSQATSLGAEGCINKPFDVFEVRRRVRAAIGDKEEMP